MALENIAEARFYLKTAGTDNPIGNVQLYSGIRETDYQADGIATPTVAMFSSRACSQQLSSLFSFKSRYHSL